MTQQSSEVLKVGSESLYMTHARPLEDYFKDSMTAEKYWNITSLSTAENRGYHGIWGIQNGSLYLISILTYRIVKKGFWFWKKYSYPQLYVVDLFPDAVNDEIKATWFTGTISADTKSMRNPADDRLTLKIADGDVVSYQWYHIEKNDGKQVFIEFEKALPDKIIHDQRYRMK